MGVDLTSAGIIGLTFILVKLSDNLTNSNQKIMLLMVLLCCVGLILFNEIKNNIHRSKAKKQKETLPEVS